MKKLFLVTLFFIGCNVRQNLDIGSAKAIEENQKTINSLNEVFQRNTATDSKLATALKKEFPKNYQIEECEKEAERTAAAAAEIANVKLSPYASLGPIAGLIAKIEWLLSPEGLVWLMGALAAIMSGRAVQLNGLVKKAIKAEPKTERKDL